MSDVQVEVLSYSDYRVFETELGDALSEGWTVVDIKTTPVIGFDGRVEDDRLVAILRRGGDETALRDRIWQRTAIEALQVQVAQLRADVAAIKHVMDDDLAGQVKDFIERVDLMMDGVDDDTAEAVPADFISLDSVRTMYGIDPRSEREALIDAEVAADLAAGARK